MRRAGYYTTYKGKWHLSTELEPDPKSEHNYSNDMNKYGLSDWNPDGDVIGNPRDGFTRDNTSMAGTIEWLRTKGVQLKAEGTPWFLSLDFVNPHDIMYFNTDVPGAKEQETDSLLMEIGRAPKTPGYAQTYDGVVPENWTQDLQEAGRPSAHCEATEASTYFLGRIPPEKERWQRFNDYYLNCMKEVDRKINRVLEEVEDLDLLQETAIIFTSDHGELAGAHGLRGKMGNAYEETIHVPLVVYAPDGPTSQSCNVATSHIDLAPTILGLAGATSEARKCALSGRDLSTLIRNPEDSVVATAQPGSLFAYSMIMSLDSGFFGKIAEMMHQGKSKAEIKASATLPDFSKRGFIRTYFDG